MSDLPEEPVVERSFSGVFLAVVGLALLASLGGLIWSYTLSSRLAKSEAALTAAQQKSDSLSAALDKTNAELKVETDALSKSVGLTQKELESRAADLQRRQEAEAKRLASEQQAASEAATKQIGAVSSQVSSVQTDVGGVKSDVAKTKSDLQATQAQLQSMKGDLGIQSGLIATNHDELEILKHKGDRNYYEFTLNKQKQPQPVSTVSLVLKKADPKKNRYTLVVVADDKQIEKKDKGTNEPVQFYTGKDNLLFELVVNNVNKNQVVGYISTPKNAPKPVTP
jgi:multidrug efflux pump subunit AcrA (membrane-fusion protein)